MSDEQDWAERKAAELLPCKHAPDARCYFHDKHGYDCAARHRPAVAAALREARAEALEEAANAVEAAALIHDSVAPGQSHSPCYFAQGHDCAPYVAGDIEAAIRALKEKHESK